MTQKCKHQVMNSGLGFGRLVPCRNAAKKDGYCGMHHPDAVAERKRKSQERFEQAMERSPYAQMRRMQERVAALEAENELLKAQILERAE